MPGKHSISVSSKRGGRSQGSQGHAPGASTKQKSMQKATMIYTHVRNRGPADVRSPVDGFEAIEGGSYTDPHKLP
jgi:hypothetical protein